MNVVAGDGPVKSSAGTYTACTDVTIEPALADVIRLVEHPFLQLVEAGNLPQKAYDLEVDTSVPASV